MDKIKGIVAEVIGFEPKDISKEDKFIPDYSISYAERKVLLEKLNNAFGREFGFDDFCKLDSVGAVIDAFTGDEATKPA